MKKILVLFILLLLTGCSISMTKDYGKFYKLEDAYNAALALESDEVVEEVKPKKRKGYTQTKE